MHYFSKHVHVHLHDIVKTKQKKEGPYNIIDVPCNTIRSI